MAVASAKKFLRTMSQPFSSKDQDGISTWSIHDLERHKEKMEEEKIWELQNEGHGGMQLQQQQQQQQRDGIRGDGNGLGPEDEFGDDMDSEMIDLINAQVES